MKTEEVSFYTDLGIKLVGLIHLPTASARGKKYPGIVMCHGFGGIREMCILPVAEWLAQAGFVSLVFDYRGFGHSEGQPRGRLIPWEHVEDIRNAFTYLQMHRNVDAQRVGICGISFGGAHASYTAGIDTRVKCTVSISGIGDVSRSMRNQQPHHEWRRLLARLEESRKSRVSEGKIEYIRIAKVLKPDPVTVEWFRKTFKQVPQMPTEITTESVEAVMQYKPEAVVSKIAPRAIMWIHSKDDDLIPYEESRQMYALASEPKKLVLVEGFAHFDLYEGEGLKAVMEPTVAWFEEHLGVANNKGDG